MEKVLIYCANGYGERVCYSIDEQFDVIGFADRCPETWKIRLAGKEVRHIDEWSGFDRIVISTSQYADEITEYLVKEKGVSPDIITVYEPRTNGFEWQEERVIQLRKCIQTINERQIEGNTAEVGVYKGDFSYYINKYLPDRKLYLFDTFSGFDTDRNIVESDDIDRFKDTSAEYVLSRMPNKENCIIRKGFFPDTADGIEDRFALVSLDCDLYEPILAGLEWFYPRMNTGGFIFVHDFDSAHYTGVKKAVHEFCDKYNIGFLPLTDRCESAIIIK